MSSAAHALHADTQTHRRIGPVGRFVALNVLGGTAVLGSYVWGVTAPGVGAALWGGVPEALRPLYTTNMLLAAAGYFFFTTVVLRRLLRARATSEDDLFARRMLAAYALVLVPSALWVPLTAWMIHAPSEFAWIAVRLDLGLVALGTLALFELVLRPDPTARGERWIALIGLLPFALQTVVLDALVWPAFFSFLPGANAPVTGVMS